MSDDVKDAIAVRKHADAHKEADMLMILKNQKVMMRAMFVMMKTMAGDMEVAEEIKAQAKANYDYLTSREE